MRMGVWQVWVALCGVLAPAQALAQAPAAASPSELRLCAEDGDSYPWLLNDRPGLNLLMIKQVEQQLGLRIQVQRLPWKRCVMLLQTGGVDGAFKMRFTPERQAFARFPSRDGKPDVTRRMLTESYHLYRLKGAPVNWDGRVLTPGGVNIGAQSGFSVAPMLKDLGASVDESTRLADVLLHKLSLGRNDMVALQTSQGDYALAQDAKLLAAIERVEPPLAVQPYFLVFAPAFADSHPQLVERVWDSIATVRESATYQRQVETFKRR